MYFHGKWGIIALIMPLFAYQFYYMSREAKLFERHIRDLVQECCMSIADTLEIP